MISPELVKLYTALLKNNFRVARIWESKSINGMLSGEYIVKLERDIQKQVGWSGFANWGDRIYLILCNGEGK